MDIQDQDNEDADAPATPRPVYERGNSPQTPMKEPDTSSTVLSGHKRPSIHAYLRDDLKVAQGVTLGTFVNIILGVRPNLLDDWVSIIREQRWYKDAVIAEGLEHYCKATLEVKRYRPLVSIANRVMEMAHGNLPSVPDTYPINDICIVRSDTMTMQTIKEHGALGAVRKPDLLTIRRIHAQNLTSQEGKGAPGLKWSQDIMNWEIKGRRDISPMYLELLEDREQNHRDEPLTDGDDRAELSVPPGRSERASPKRRLAGRANRRRIQRTVSGATATGSTAAGVEVAMSQLTAAEPTSAESTVAELAVPGSTPTVHAGVKRRADRSLLNDVRKSDPPDERYAEHLGSSDAACLAAKDASIQVGSYALETMSCTYGTRLFCINVAVENDRLFFWYYDACGFICTVEGISLIADFEKAAAILVGFACCTPERLGALPDIFVPPPSAPYPQNWPPENLSNHTLTLRRPKKGKLMVTFEEPVFTQYAISGRRTFVYKIKTSPTLSKKELIMKLSYQVSTRKKEQDLVGKAKRAGVGHMPQIHLSNDLWKMSDGVRSAFFEEAGIEYEDRTLRVIIYSRYLPLQALFPHSPECLCIMAKQIIECLYDLREKAKILHRDISLQNVMHEYRDGELYFILIDFDMATIVSTGDDAPYVPSSKHRTGTLPFMAVELIDNAAKFYREPEVYVPIAHWVRHDVESVFWLALWCIMVLMEPIKPEEYTNKENNIKLAKRWETQDLRAITNEKDRVRRQSLAASEIVLLGKAKCLEPWFRAWKTFWIRILHAIENHEDAADAATARGDAPPSFDYETVNGLFTRDKLMKALDGVPPPLSVVDEADIENQEATVPGSGEAGTPVHEEAALQAGITGTTVRKASAPTKATAPSRKARATKKHSTTKRNVAAAKAKADTSIVPARSRRTRAAAQRENSGDDDIRKRLRPRKRVNYKI